MKCTICRGQAALEIRRHNAAFCAPHFLEFFERQVERAVRDQKMFTHENRVLVAVSGGKDSLALWDVLLRLNYRATGLYIHLGIGAYSEESRAKSVAFAQSRGADLIVVDLPQEHGMNVEELARNSGRVSCSACGLSKRYIFNKVAVDQGFDVVATGHNLDDEAAVLMGNLLHWQVEYLVRQAPVLPSTHPRMVRKVKPLYRIAEREAAAYAVLRGIDYIVEECPNSLGARSLLYKEALNMLEAQSPGTKQSLYWGFLEHMRPRLAAVQEGVTLRDCLHCGQPTTGEVCAFCKMTERAAARMRARLVRAQPASSGPPPEETVAAGVPAGDAVDPAAIAGEPIGLPSGPDDRA
ncbi:MAG: TIGR00269 family protein [Armatimonadetes bacterium]|nr:TIGR00269 family protein [Armatimonadota bacterium]